MGRKAIPTVLKVLRGNASKQNLKAIAAKEPKSPPSHLDPPPDLEGPARERWVESVPILQTMKVWGEAERETWSRYCRLYALWHECHDVLKRQGQTYEKPSGVIAARPEAGLLMQYTAELRRIECEFGLTPASRAGAAVHDNADDPLTSFMREAQ